MSKYEYFTFLFIDSFFANISITFKQELAIKVMKVFDPGNIILIISACIMSNILATIINFFTGQILYKLIIGDISLEPKNYATIKTFLSRYWIYIALLIPIPSIGNIYNVFLGMYKFHLPQIIAITTINRLAYYSYYFIM